MKYLIPLLCGLLLLLSCKRSLTQNNEIIKVELARSGAWSDYGATISMDTSLNYKYFGDYMNWKQKYFAGKISPKYWDSVNQKFEKINFKTVAPHSKLVILDDDYFELIIYWKGGRRSITRYWDGGQEPILKVFDWLSSSYKSVKLEQVNTPFKFETTTHRKPKPKIDQAKFPPPIKQ